MPDKQVAAGYCGLEEALYQRFLRETVETVKVRLNPKLKVMGILLTRYNGRTCLARDVLEMAGQLAAQMKTKVFESKIRNGVAVAEAPAHGENIFTYSPRSAAVKDYRGFIEEVATMIGM